MTQEELITGQTNTEWVDYLPTVIKAINKYLAHRKKPKPSHTPFIVYKIKGKKKSGNRVYYQVQWKGFPQEKDWTWEPKTTFMRNETLCLFRKPWQEV